MGMACQSQITTLGLVTNVSGTRATVWVFPTNYDREPEIEIDFKQRRLPLALGDWIYLKKDDYGRLRYKIMDENDYPLQTSIDARNIVNVKSKFVFLKNGNKEHSTMDDDGMCAWSPDFGLINACSSYHLSDAYIYEGYLERIPGEPSTKTTSYWSIIRKSPIERVDHFAFDTVLSSPEHRLVMNRGMIVDECNDGWIVWSRISGRTILPKENCTDVGISQWISFLLKLPKCGEPMPIIKKCIKIRPPLTSRIEGGKLKVRIGDENSTSGGIFPQLRSSFLGYIRGCSEMWAVWDGKGWCLDMPISTISTSSPQTNENVKQGFVGKLDKQLIFLGIDAAFDAILKETEYSDGWAIQQGDWITADVSTDESCHVRIANNPQKLVKTPFPSRLNDRGDVEVQTIINNFRFMNHERFGESMDLGLVADIYDVINGHSTDKFLVWCHRLMKPLENGCVWALVKGAKIHKVDEKFSETGSKLSDGSQRRRSDHDSRDIDALNMAMQPAAKRMEATTVAEMLDCIRNVISCQEISQIIRQVNPRLHSEIISILINL